MSGEHFVICGSIALVPNSIPIHCADCGTDIVISPATLAKVGPDAKTMCPRCGFKRVDAEKEGVEVSPPSKGQLEEFTRYFQRGFEE